MTPAALHLAPRTLRPRRAKGLTALGIGLLCFALLSTSSSGAATAPGLGTAESFAVLAGSTVTNTGLSVVSGDLGVSPGTAVTGFATSTPPGPGLVINGTISTGAGVAAQAQVDALAAYGALGSQPCAADDDLSGDDLGGLTLTAGVYCFSSSAQLTGALSLDAEGDPAAVFIFQVGTTLTTASASSVLLLDAAAPCNVFWRIGSSATLGTSTDFAGTVLADQSITAATGADVEGRLIALNGAVTLDTNDITSPACSTGGTDSAGTDGAAGTDGTAATDSTDAATDDTDGATDAATDGTDGATDAATDGETSGGSDGRGVDRSMTDAATDGTTSGGSDATSGPTDGPTGVSDESTDEGSTGGAITRNELDRPTLPRTGSGLILAVAGAASISAGILCSRMSRRLLVRGPRQA